MSGKSATTNLWVWRLLPVFLALGVSFITSWGSLQRHEVRISNNEKDIENLQALDHIVSDLNTSVQVQAALIDIANSRINECCSRSGPNP